MHCEEVTRQLGRYVDKELSATERDNIEAHLESCPTCRSEVAELRELATRIADTPSVPIPDRLWPSIERRLSQAEVAKPPLPPVMRLRTRTAFWAIAASVVLAIGLGIFGLPSLYSTAQASSVDFGVLLDALPLDAQKAFRKFLVRYDAKPTTPVAARRSAGELNFDTPAVLPGGFRLQSIYELRIGGTKGIAAAYDRDGEFLAVVFHPPMKHEQFGSHESNPCVIGEHCGHKVQVGEWKLVHLTDPTTCHCLLSRLDEQSEIPMVMKAIAPTLADMGATDDHHDP